MPKKQTDKEFVLSRYPNARAVRRKLFGGTKMYGWVIEGVGSLPVSPQQRGEETAWATTADAIRVYRPNQ